MSYRKGSSLKDILVGAKLLQRRKNQTTYSVQWLSIKKQVNQLSNDRRSCRCENFRVKQTVKKNSAREGGGPDPPTHPLDPSLIWQIIQQSYRPKGKGQKCRKVISAKCIYQQKLEVQQRTAVWSATTITRTDSKMWTSNTANLLYQTELTMDDVAKMERGMNWPSITTPASSQEVKVGANTQR